MATKYKKGSELPGVAGIVQSMLRGWKDATPGIFDAASRANPHLGLLVGPEEQPAAQPALPDLTDEAVQKAKKRQALMVMQGRGRRSTFLTGPMGVPTEQVVGRRTLLGGM